MIWAWNRGDAVAASAGGEPPALLITTSTPPNRSIRGRDQLPRLLGVPDVRPGERGGPAARGRQAGAVRGLVPAADQHPGAGAQEPRAMPAPMPLVPPVTITRAPERPGND